MTDMELAFRQAIVEEPDDDNLRLIFADWLSDQGRDFEEGLIRRGCTADGNIDRDSMLYMTNAIYPQWIDGVIIHRGLIAQIVCNQDKWLAHGRKFVQIHPLRAVILGDKEARRIPRGDRDRTDYALVYGDDYINAIDGRIFNLLESGEFSDCGLAWYRFYPTQKDATIDLSQASLQWAKGTENADL